MKCVLDLLNKTKTPYMRGHERLLINFIMFEVTRGLGMLFHFLYFQDGIHNFGICANKSCGHSP